jgi:hypothetical protein
VSCEVLRPGGGRVDTGLRLSYEWAGNGSVPLLLAEWFGVLGVLGGGFGRVVGHAARCFLHRGRTGPNQAGLILSIRHRADKASSAPSASPAGRFVLFSSPSSPGAKHANIQDMFHLRVSRMSSHVIDLLSFPPRQAVSFKQVQDARERRTPKSSNSSLQTSNCILSPTATLEAPKRLRWAANNRPQIPARLKRSNPPL